jgi:hypothetical protein
MKEVIALVIIGLLLMIFTPRNSIYWYGGLILIVGPGVGYLLQRTQQKLDL